jgi:hypothetical protein
MGWLERAVQIADLVGKTLIPIVVAVIGYFGVRWLAQESARTQAEVAVRGADATADDRDASIMASFAELYEKNPKLAIRYASLIRRDKIKNSVLHYVIWDALEKNLMADGGPTWADDHPSWHLIGDAAWILRETPPGENQLPFDLWWECDLRRFSITDRWKTHAAQLEQKFRWLEQTFKLPVQPFAAGSVGRCK